MEFSRLGIWIRAVAVGYAIATAVPDPSCICNLHHSSWQCQILNPLNKARDRTCFLMDMSQICFHCTTAGTPAIIFLDSSPATELCFLLLQGEIALAHVWCLQSFLSTLYSVVAPGSSQAHGTYMLSANMASTRPRVKAISQLSSGFSKAEPLSSNSLSHQNTATLAHIPAFSL